MCLQLACSPVSAQASGLNLSVASHGRINQFVGVQSIWVCTCAFISVYLFKFQPTYPCRQELTLFKLHVLTQLTFLQRTCLVYSGSIHRTPGLDSANKHTWFWPLQSSTGLMSGRKKGFPPSLQEKHAQFDDTFECSKLLFHGSANRQLGLLSHLVSSRHPSGRACGEFSLWISSLKNLIVNTDTSVWNA